MEITQFLKEYWIIIILFLFGIAVVYTVGVEKFGITFIPKPNLPKEKPVLTSHGFTNYYPPTQLEGSITLVNNGENSLNSNGFKLYLNKELVDNDGCKIKGMIDPGYTCTLNFYEMCRNGDVLEVQYYGERAYIELC